MKGKTPSKAAPSQNAASKPKNRNPGKQQRQRNREKAKANQPKPTTNRAVPVVTKTECTNPRFHPHHCDCPVHEDVLAFLDESTLRGSAKRETAAVTSHFLPSNWEENPNPVKSVVVEPEPEPEQSRLSQLALEAVGNERFEELTQKLRDSYCEIGELKSKNKGLQKAIESLENRLLEARNGRKGKTERRKKVRNKRASDKAFEHGIMRVGRETNDNW